MCSCTTLKPPGSVEKQLLHFSPQYELDNQDGLLRNTIALPRLTLSQQILDTNPTLHFSLLRLQLIELIRTALRASGPPTAASFTPAIEFATSQLAPRAPTSPAFLQDLERTMALLIFPTDKLTPQLKALLEPGLRHTVATSVNEAILESQGERREARIKNLLRLRVWAEQKARSAKLDLPDNLDLGTGSSSSNDTHEGLGEGDAMMT